MIVFKWVTTHRLCKVCMLRYVCLAFPNVLKSEETDMIHSRANQLTRERVRTRVNAGAVSNRSTIVGILVQSHDRYVKLTRDVVV